MHSLKHSPLGKIQNYVSTYDPTLLFPIPRIENRKYLNLKEDLPFKGVDIWNAYEISWLNLKGKPVVALAEFIFPCDSSHIVESKSFKLYLNSLNSSRFNDSEQVLLTLEKDLMLATGKPPLISLKMCNEISEQQRISSFNGNCLDHLDITCETYSVDASLLQIEETMVTEVLFSNLLKSNCPVTHQPDWASVQIEYSGNKIKHTSLLQYIISFREHNEFHEHCVERIFSDIMQHCKPHKLSVYARYTRRGGLDINPFRSTERMRPLNNERLYRQ